MSNEKRRHTATRWYGGGPRAGQSGLRCNGCDWHSGHEGTRRDQEERHRQHRRDVGEHPAQRKNTTPIEVTATVKLDDLAGQLSQLDKTALLDLVMKIDEHVQDANFTIDLVNRLTTELELEGRILIKPVYN